MSSSSPASQAESAAALRALFTAFPTDRAEGPGFAATYLMAIEGFSLQAIETAVRRIVRGEADDIDRRYLPSPAQLGNLVAYLEKLYEPPTPRQALPAPGDGVRTAEEQARIDALVSGWRKAAGREVFQGETVVDREAIPAAKRAQLDRAIAAVAERIKAEGLPKLSEEAKRLFRQQSESAVPDPSEQYEAWQTSRDGRAA